MNRYHLLALGALSSMLPPAAARADTYFKGPDERARAFAEVTRLREIQGRHLQQTMALPGVVGMGIGLDRPTGWLVFDVMVDADAPPPLLPPTLEGTPVRLVRQPRVSPNDTCTAAGTACHADLQALPVEMGNTGHTGPVAAPGGSWCHRCSLGFKACDVQSGDTVYVTAAHCSKGTASTCAGGAAAGAPTYHRSPGDAVMCAVESTIGTVAKQRPPLCTDSVDAASVRSDGSQTQLSIRDIGVPSYLPGAVLPGDGVQKSGRTTGFTLGIVTDVAAVVVTVDPGAYCNCTGGVTFIDQLRIERAWSGLGFPIPAAVYWARSGDSGSAVLTEDGVPPAIVGLNVLGDASGTLGYANPIGAVMAELDLSLNMLDCASNPCAATEAARFSSEPRPLLRATTDFRDRVLSGSERGRRYIETYYRFTGDLVAIMRAQPELAARTAAVYAQQRPLLEALAAGRPASATARQIDAIDALFARFQQAAPEPELRQAVGLWRHDLRDPQVLRDFGVTVR